MSTSLKPLLAGVAAFALLAASLPAQARDDQSHVMTVQLPDGGVARIAYTGDTPPQVVLAAPPSFAAALSPMVLPAFAVPAFAMPPSFAALERVSEAMDRQADLMLRQAAALPADVHVYRAESTITSDGTCTRRTEITFIGNGAAPKEVTSLSGNCTGAPQRAIAPAPAPHDHDQPRLIEVRAQPDHPHLVKEALWQSR